MNDRQDETKVPQLGRGHEPSGSEGKFPVCDFSFEFLSHFLFFCLSICTPAYFDDGVVRVCLVGRCHGDVRPEGRPPFDKVGDRHLLAISGPPGIMFT